MYEISELARRGGLRGDSQRVFHGHERGADGGGEGFAFGLGALHGGFHVRFASGAVELLLDLLGLERLFGGVFLIFILHLINFLKN